MYAACREALMRHGIDPEKAALLDHCSDNPNLEQYHLLTPDQRLIILDITFSADNTAEETYWGDHTDDPNERMNYGTPWDEILRVVQKNEIV